MYKKRISKKEIDFIQKQQERSISTHVKYVSFPFRKKLFIALPLEIQRIIIAYLPPKFRLVCKSWNAWWDELHPLEVKQMKSKLYVYRLEKEAMVSLERDINSTFDMELVIFERLINEFKSCSLIRSLIQKELNQ